MAFPSQGTASLSSPPRDEIGSDVVIGIPEPWIDLDGPVTRENRAFVVSSAGQGPAKKRVSLGRGHARERPLVERDRLIEVPFCLPARIVRPVGVLSVILSARPHPRDRAWGAPSSASSVRGEASREGRGADPRRAQTTPSSAGLPLSRRHPSWRQRPAAAWSMTRWHGDTPRITTVVIDPVRGIFGAPGTWDGSRCRMRVVTLCNTREKSVRSDACSPSIRCAIVKGEIEPHRGGAY